MRSRPSGRSCRPCSTRRSRVTVIGFGGVNHVAPNQNPVDVVCQPTIASGTRQPGLPRVLREQAAPPHRAGGRRHRLRRRARPGDELPEPEHHRRAAVPGRGDQGHPDDDRRRRGRAPRHPAVRQRLAGTASSRRSTSSCAAARSDGVQVWPLGFGTDIGTGITEPQALQYLNQIAAGGAPAVCDKRHVANQPHATWVNNPSDAINALNQLYADAALPRHRLGADHRRRRRPDRHTVGEHPRHRQRRRDQRRPGESRHSGEFLPAGRPVMDRLLGDQRAGHLSRGGAARHQHHAATRWGPGRSTSPRRPGWPASW